MKAPVSWIRDYVDLPADVTTEQLAARLTALGLKLEAIEKPGEQIRGPLVVGKVLTMEPEPQKNGKTIEWCKVDVGAANGTGEPQGIVCGAHNFAPGDLVVVILPGGVLPGDFEISARKTYGHVSAGMICSSRELGIGEDHEGIIVLPEGAGEPGTDARPVLGLDQEVIEFEINPDRAYALSLRGVAREAALAYDAPYTDPAQRDVPAPNGDGYPVVIDDPVGCPVFVARVVSGIDPEAATPDWMAQRLALSGMRPISLAVDITNYVMLELGRPIHGYDADKLRGPIRVRRATEGERLTTLDGVDRALSTEDLVVTDDSGIIGLGGVMGGETTEMSATTTRVLVEAAHWDAVSMFRTGKRHKLTSEAGKRNERGVDPVITPAAADRVVELLVQYGGGTAEPGVTVVGEAPHPAAISMAADLPARISGIDIPAETAVANLEKVGCLVGDGEYTPPTWRPDLTDPYDLVEEVVRIVGYDQVPSVAAPRGRRPRAHPRAAAAPADRPHPGRRRLCRGDQLPVRRRGRLRPARAARGRPAAPHGPAGQPALGRGAVVHHDAAARPAPRGRPQPRPRHPGRRAVRDRHRGVPGRPRPGADLRRRLAAQRRRAGQAVRGDPRAAAAPGRRAGRRARARRLVGRRAYGGLVGRDRAGPPAGRRARRRRRGGLGQPDALAPGPLRPGPAWTGSSSATPASCTRTRARRSGCRPAPRPSRSTSTS